MQFQIIVAVLAISLVTFDSCQATALLTKNGNIPALCEPGVIDEMPDNIKKVCIALANSEQLSNALNSYLRNEAAG